MIAFIHPTQKKSFHLVIRYIVHKKHLHLQPSLDGINQPLFASVSVVKIKATLLQTIMMMMLLMMMMVPMLSTLVLCEEEEVCVQPDSQDQLDLDYETGWNNTNIMHNSVLK